MTTHYEVLRPVAGADLDAIPSVVKALRMIPEDGIIAFNMFKGVNKSAAVRTVAHACKAGMLRRVSPCLSFCLVGSCRSASETRSFFGWLLEKIHVPD